MSQVNLVLSDGTESFAPCAILGDDGLWTVWQGYGQGEERIFARFCDRKGLGEPEVISAEGGYRHAPFVGLVNGPPTAVWIEASEGRHGVMYSTRSDSGWTAPAPAGRQAQVISLHAASGQNRMWTTWCEAETPGTFSIRASAYDGKEWGEAIRVSGSNAWVQRPEVAAAEGGCWISWDAYDGLIFSVWAAFVGDDKTVSAPQRVSAPPEAEGRVTRDAWQFVPSICVDTDGAPWVTWLCSQDVVGEHGVVDQWPTARVSRLDPDGWKPVLDEEGCADLGRLAWGLLYRGGAGVWGYLGRRRKPMVVADPAGGAWLLWERKEMPEGGTPTTGGILCGRKLDRGIVGATQAVGRGPRWYAPAGIEEHRLWVACRVDPDTSTEDVCVAGCDLEDASLLEEEDFWTGWRPIVIREPQPDPRPEVQVDGQGECSLYWADLHSHTGLSADAEGEVDELIAYARDKARLDCVVFQDNDKYLLSLTPSEYEAYRLYLRQFHRDGAFVLLPAFEWTYMSSDKSFVCHRTVIGQDEDFPLLRHSEVEVDPMDAIAAHAEAHGALLHAHHESWELTDSATEVNVEVCSGWRNHMLDPTYLCKIHDLLTSGRRFGFFGGSDNHRRNPGLGGGLTGIYAAELTRNAILDALRRHRCFATDGSRVVVKFWVNDAFMGGEVTSSEAPEIRWEVVSVAPPATVRLIRDGVCICTWQAGDSQGSGSYVDRDCRSGNHFYYLSVEQSNSWRHYPSNVAVAWGPHAWSSPIWVKQK